LPAWPQHITRQSLRRATQNLSIATQSFETKTFDWTIADEETARRMIEGLYLPNADRARKESAIEYLISRSERKPTVPIHMGRAVLTKRGA
jgi:hypothetical protein